MLNVSRPSCVWSILLCLLATLAGSTAKGQDEAPPPTALQKQLDHMDLAVSGVGIFNHSVSGTVTLGGTPGPGSTPEPTPLTLSPGNTLGALVTLRYIAKPLVGLEFNFGYSRYTDTFSTIGGVQQNAREYTFGYVAHTPPLLGVHPFAAIGLGTTAFRPTPGGGLGLLEQARATYYYSVGAEDTVLSPHFGLRVQVRQAFFLAPDFGQNYLTMKQHTSTFEPGFGFFLRF